MGYVIMMVYYIYIMNNTSLIHRLNRAQGQIEAIKRSLTDETQKDCLETIRLLKAAQNALKKFAQVYVSSHLEECLSHKASKEDIQKGLKKVIESAFSL